MNSLKWTATQVGMCHWLMAPWKIHFCICISHHFLCLTTTISNLIIFVGRGRHFLAAKQYTTVNSEQWTLNVMIYNNYIDLVCVRRLMTLSPTPFCSHWSNCALVRRALNVILPSVLVWWNRCLMSTYSSYNVQFQSSRKLAAPLLFQNRIKD